MSGRAAFAPNSASSSPARSGDARKRKAARQPTVRIMMSSQGGNIQGGDRIRLSILSAAPGPGNRPGARFRDGSGRRAESRRQGPRRAAPGRLESGRSTRGGRGRRVRSRRSRIGNDAHAHTTTSRVRDDRRRGGLARARREGPAGEAEARVQGHADAPRRPVARPRRRPPAADDHHPRHDRRPGGDRRATVRRRRPLQRQGPSTAGGARGASPRAGSSGTGPSSSRPRGPRAAGRSPARTSSATARSTSSSPPPTHPRGPTRAGATAES